MKFTDQQLDNAVKYCQQTLELDKSRQIPSTYYKGLKQMEVELWLYKNVNLVFFDNNHVKILNLP